MADVKLKISENYFFDNAELLLPALKSSTGTLIEGEIRHWLTQTYDLTPKNHTDKGVTRIGYNADELNKALRKKMSTIPGIHNETCVAWNALISKGKEGFDFSVFDEEYNIIKLRNSFVGDPGRFGGEKQLESIGKYVISSSGTLFKKQRDWKAKLAMLGGKPGINIDGKKSRYTIVGEIQFGNWALAEHDLLRLMNSSLDGEIDYYIYVTATGDLEGKLSKGIVTYSKVVDLFKNNKTLFRTPVWVIGLDIDNA